MRDYDLNPVFDGDDAIDSTLPDFCGRVWFVSRKGGVGYVDPANGSTHAYTKTRDEDDPWYLTAIEFRTGETAYKRNASPASVWATTTTTRRSRSAPDGTAYVGVLGGLVALRDSATP